MKEPTPNPGTEAEFAALGNPNAHVTIGEAAELAHYHKVRANRLPEGSDPEDILHATVNAAYWDKKRAELDAQARRLFG